jgi:hypothetical protein
MKQFNMTHWAILEEEDGGDGMKTKNTTRLERNAFLSLLLTN